MTSGAVIAVAMTLNELCTNATKFGALAVPGGRVDISWMLDFQRAASVHELDREETAPAVRTSGSAQFRHATDRNSWQAVQGGT